MGYSIKTPLMINGRVRAVIVIFLFGLFALAMMPSALAKGEFFQQIPQGYERSCNLCHVQPPVLNQFGQDFKQNGYKFPSLAGSTDKPDPGTGSGTAGAKDQPVGGSAGTTAREKQAAKIELMLPGSVQRGEKVSAKARVSVGGQPVAGKQVKFYEQADFFIQGKVFLGEANTDAQGVAAINYWTSATDDQVKLVAGIAGDDQLQPAEAGVSLTVIQGGSLVEHPEGLRVPFVGTWLIVVLVGAVWACYLYAVYSVMQIRKLGQRSAQQEEAGQKEKQMA